MYLCSPYRNSTGTYCKQRGNKGRFRKNKNHSRLEIFSQSKTSQSFIRAYKLLQEIYSPLLRYDISSKIFIKRKLGVWMEWIMWCIIRHFKEKISRGTHSLIPKFVSKISCTHRCIWHRNRCNTDTTRRWWNGLSNRIE